MVKNVIVENSREWGVSEILFFKHPKIGAVLKVVIPWKFAVFSFNSDSEKGFDIIREKYEYSFPVSNMKDFKVEILDHSDRPEFEIISTIPDEKKLEFEKHLEFQWWKSGFSYFKSQGWQFETKKYYIYDGFSINEGYTTIENSFEHAE